MKEYYLANYHTHGKWCNHGSGEEEKYIHEAIQNGMKVLGFSEHAPFPDNRFWRMNYDELDEYIKEIDRLKEKHKDVLHILCGLEIEYFSDQEKYYKKLLEQKNIDYLILGQHYFDYKGKIFRTKELKNTKEVLLYARSLCEAMRTKLFKVIAHPDYFGCNDFVLDEYLYQAMQLIIDTAQDTNTILEINCNGFRKKKIKSKMGYRNKYPLNEFWKMVMKSEANVIIGGDYHANGLFEDKSIKSAYKIVKKYNLNQIKNNIITNL